VRVKITDMASGQASGLKRFVLWDYARATWQYDVMVALILAFLFLTPRDLFRDRPRPPRDIIRVSSDHGTNLFYLEPQLLADIPETARAGRASELVRARFGKQENLFHLQPIAGNDSEVKGYVAFTKH
jgi:hypothetical protein